MNWSMPRPVLQWVAITIGALWLGAFALGVATAPERGRLPGEQPGAAAGQPLQATEATPLGEERIEGPPPPPELTDEEKAKIEADKKAKAEADAAAKAEAEKAAATPEAPPPDTPAVPPPDAAQKPAAPSSEEPPF